MSTMWSKCLVVGKRQFALCLTAGVALCLGMSLCPAVAGASPSSPAPPGPPGPSVGSTHNHLTALQSEAAKIEAEIQLDAQKVEVAAESYDEYTNEVKVDDA